MAAEIFVHPQALVESVEIGAGTRVWAFAHVMAGAIVGADCNIGDHAFVESGATIGDRVTIKNGVMVWNGVTIEDDVLFAANVFIADGTHGMARGDVAYKYQGIERVAPVHIERGAWIGQNVMLMPGVRIGAFAVVGANSVVRDDVPGSCVAVGTPARVIRRWDAGTERWLAVEQAPRPGSNA